MNAGRSSLRTLISRPASLLSREYPGLSKTVIFESISAFSADESWLWFHASMCTVLYPAKRANCQTVGRFSPDRQLFGKSDCRIPKRNIVLEMCEQLPLEIATPKFTKVSAA